MLYIFPTETFYGLGCDATDSAALESIRQSKTRPAPMGFPIIVASAELAIETFELSPRLKALAEIHWPGPLSIVAKPTLDVQHAGRFPDSLTAEDGTVAFRVSPNPIAQSLAKKVGGFLVSTSANLRGEAPARRLSDVHPEIRALGIGVDGGETPGGLPSTIVAEKEGKLCVLREGALSSEVLG